MIEDCKGFTMYRLSEHDLIAKDKVPYIIDELISSKVTLLYGRSEVGKSMFIDGGIAAITRGAKSFIGQDVLVDFTAVDVPVGILCGDFEDASLAYERIKAAKGDLDKVEIYDASDKLPFDNWADLIEQVIAAGHKLLVIDNLSVFVDGDVNESSKIKKFFDMLSPLMGAGVAVVVIAHSSEKFSRFGQPQDFIGASNIKQRSSRRIKIERPEGSDNLRLTLAGNRSGRQEVMLRWPKQSIPVYERIGSSDNKELNERREKAKQERDAKTKATADKIRDHVLGKCRGMNNTDTARSLFAAKLVKSESTARNALRDGRYGVRLADDGSWADARLKAV
jgi:RecA-family ATPase